LVLRSDEPSRRRADPLHLDAEELRRMGCGQSKKDRPTSRLPLEAGDCVQEHQYSSTFKIVMRLTRNGNGSRLIELYRRWPVPPNDEKEIVLQDGTTHLSWPRSWEEVEKEFLELHDICTALTGEMAGTGVLTAEEVAAIKAETVDNPKRPHIDENCVTWPCIQELFRDAWVAVHKREWDPAEHAAGMDWHVLLRSNNLALKANGLRQKLEEIDHQAAVQFIWDVFAAWPNPEEDVTEVERLSFKSGKSTTKKTWPLKWEVKGNGKCVVKTLKSCGWDEFLIEALHYQLFDNQKMNKLSHNCTPDEVCWPDLQQAFRSSICDGQWTENDTREWPPLGPKVTLRLKIQYEKIPSTLLGEWRMYCKPDRGQGFSYGLIINEVDLEKTSFIGRAQSEDKYAVEDGKISHHLENCRTTISYTEQVWPNGQRDRLSAHVKSNAKLQFENEDACEQKATREDLNLPAASEDRIGAHVSQGIQKYYLNDADSIAEHVPAI